MEESQKIKQNDRIFCKQIVQQFLKHHILFVYNDDEKIVGVAHFSDFNHPIVYSYLYQKLMHFETSLRDYLDNQSVSDYHIIDYYYEKKESCKEKEKKYFCDRIDYFKHQRNIIRELKPFQIFQLTDLIRYVNSRFKLKIDVGKLNEIRNATMHFRDFVHHQGSEDSSIIYDDETFRSLIESMEYLSEQQQKLEKLDP